VRPTDHTGTLETNAGTTEDMIARALRDRIELASLTSILITGRISQIAARNAVLPCSLTAVLWRHGASGSPNPQSHVVSTAHLISGGRLRMRFNNSAPDYYSACRSIFQYEIECEV